MQQTQTFIANTAMKPTRTIPLLLLGCQSLAVRAFSPSHINSNSLRPSQTIPATTPEKYSPSALRAEDSDSDGNNLGSSDLSWLRNAMDAPSPMEPDGLFLLETKQGISGFAVDPERGFVVVLVGGDRATYAVVSPKDKQQVQSPEALCLVQLAGGLDLGTPVLSPDLLARIVADEIDSDARELRQKVKLRRVDVVASEQEHSERRERVHPPPKNSTPERDANIKEQAPKVTAAVKNLPGLGECTLEQVIEGMKSHADENGQVNRDAFTELLQTLRSRINYVEPSKVQFVLVVDYEDQQLSIPAPSVMSGVGLALRYKVDVVLAKECQMEGFDVVEIASKFPAFRPLKELEEDAKIMDGFIPAMFNEATAPDNDDKM